MNQETTSNKIIRELKTLKGFSVSQLETVRTYLDMTYSIGFNEGKSFIGGPKPVIQLNKYGVKINEYSSGSEAIRILGINR